MLAIFLVALVLFVTVAIPLYASAAIIILLPPRICQPAMSSSPQRTAGAAASRTVGGDQRDAVGLGGRHRASVRGRRPADS